VRTGELVEKISDTLDINIEIFPRDVRRITLPVIPSALAVQTPLGIAEAMY